MTKQKKAILVIFGIIIFVFSVFLGLGYLGQITGGNSLVLCQDLVQVKMRNFFPF